jgi:hypothetical protein
LIDWQSDMNTDTVHIFRTMKLALVLCAVAVILSAAFVIHIGATGSGVPFPDPTPAQAAYERSQSAISSRILFAAALAWIATLIAAGMQLIRRRR